MGRNKHPVAVVVDPIVGCKLRPHQIEGVQFLYDCTWPACAQAACLRPPIHPICLGV